MPTLGIFSHEGGQFPGGYTQSEREARNYTRTALRRVGQLIEVTA